MDIFRADLHCHTTCSDGSKTPAEIIALAKELGLSAISITDHDSIEAYATASILCEKANIVLLPGAEFSANQAGDSVHILGYGFDIESRAITRLCERHTERRKMRNYAILERLSQNKMPISYEELIDVLPKDSIKHRQTIGRPHIALAMIKKRYVATVQEAFNKYLGEGKLCYVQGESISVEETIKAIHEARGIAVMAHPHLIKNPLLLKELLKQKFDGIECYYGNFPAARHDRWLKIAKKHDLLVTGGSDFHGEAKPLIPLACSWIGKELFSLLTDKIKTLK